MSFRSRLTFALLLATLLPLLALAVVVRTDMQKRLTQQYRERVAGVVNAVEDALDEKRSEAATDLQSIQASIENDNRFRLSLESGSTESRRYIIDYAERSIQLTGLSALLIVNDRDRILSSGHFRNEYDRVDRGLSQLMAGTDTEYLLLELRTADSVFTALSTISNFEIAGSKLSLIGGISIDDLINNVQLSNPDLVLTLVHSDSTELAAGSFVTRRIELQHIDLERIDISTSGLILSYATTELASLKRNVDRWLLVVGGAALLVAILVAGWLGRIMSGPIAELSSKTRLINLDNLNVNFHSSRSDEIGDLSRTLALMTTRLRKSKREIVDAERRAAIGDISRQINHDIKNGLTPIRNIVQHFDDTVNDDSGDLTAVFGERRNTLLSSIEYLRQLASNYSKLSPPSDRSAIDIVSVLQNIVDDTSQSGHRAISFTSTYRSIHVAATQLAIRRIFENIVGNAVDASPSSDSPIVVSVSSTENAVAVRIEDHGGGILEEHQPHVFDDFFTTKDAGTGLGLSIVRRLVMDLHGSIRLEHSSPNGSCFLVTLPLTDKH